MMLSNKLRRYFVIFVVAILIVLYKLQIDKSIDRMIAISRHHVPKRISERNSKLRILFYSAVLNTLLSGNSRYEVDRKRFVFNESLPKQISKQGISKNKIYRYKAHKKFLQEVIEGYHVVVFHVKDMPRGKLLKDVNKSRPLVEGKRQIWAYFNKESPYNTINIRDGRYDDIFNMMITTSRRSEVFAPYGLYKAKAKRSDPWRTIGKERSSVIYNDAVDNEKELRYFFKSIDKPFRRPSLSIQEEEALLSMDLKFEEKDFMVAWVVSNCHHVRDYYIRSLLRYLPIHIYGKCARFYNQNKKCYKNEYSCERLLRRYKFVLAFENSFCEDYVSDKYWNALFRGNVPVVLGGSQYDERLVVPGSFINARSFDTSESLAKHLMYLNKNKDDYNKYFAWRKIFAIDFIPNDHYRLEYISEGIYKAMENENVGERTYNLSTWFSRKKNCPHNSLPKKIW